MNIFHSFSATVPSEIQKHDPEVQRAFLRAMWSGEVQVYRGRIMFIGQDRAGKTSLKKSLLGDPFDPQEDSTEGIEINPSKFEVDVDHAMNWHPTEQKDLAVHEFNEDIAKIIATDLMHQNSLSVQVTVINNFLGFKISLTCIMKNIHLFRHRQPSLPAAKRSSCVIAVMVKIFNNYSLKSR